ncbi:hypothetical protein U9M48_014330 [Paspalum notatum var. saurae]|uniref:Uncharacterized protein n=1 Tax=Paspalum notatum var. saurae TaxID=547442 RepID=A0AAQ3WKD1_PASNO
MTAMSLPHTYFLSTTQQRPTTSGALTSVSPSRLTTAHDQLHPRRRVSTYCDGRNALSSTSRRPGSEPTRRCSSCSDPPPPEPSAMRRRTRTVPSIPILVVRVAAPVRGHQDGLDEGVQQVPRGCEGVRDYADLTPAADARAAAELAVLGSRAAPEAGAAADPVEPRGRGSGWRHRGGASGPMELGTPALSRRWPTGRMRGQPW